MCNELTIQVDNYYVLPGELALHFQADPFPGGHRYQMTIPRNRISSKVLRHARFEETDCPSEHQARNWFYWIPAILQLQSQEEDIRARFILNNIHELRIGIDDIFLKGACSPFVRSS